MHSLKCMTKQKERGCCTHDIPINLFTSPDILNGSTERISEYDGKLIYFRCGFNGDDADDGDKPLLCMIYMSVGVVEEPFCPNPANASETGYQKSIKLIV